MARPDLAGDAALREGWGVFVVSCWAQTITEQQTGWLATLEAPCHVCLPPCLWVVQPRPALACLSTPRIYLPPAGRFLP